MAQEQRKGTSVCLSAQIAHKMDLKICTIFAGLLSTNRARSKELENLQYSATAEFFCRFKSEPEVSPISRRRPLSPLGSEISHFSSSLFRRRGRTRDRKKSGKRPQKGERKGSFHHPRQMLAKNCPFFRPHCAFLWC